MGKAAKTVMLVLVALVVLGLAFGLLEGRAAPVARHVLVKVGDADPVTIMVAAGTQVDVIHKPNYGTPVYSTGEMLEPIQYIAGRMVVVYGGDGIMRDGFDGGAP